MTITYQVERFTDLRPEIEPHIAAHWEEFASEKAAFPMDVDWGLYESLCRSGKLHVFTARRDGALIGYFGCIVTTHPHRRSVRTANSAFLYAVPGRIRPLVVMRLIEQSVRYFMVLGIRLYQYRSKNSNNLGKMLEKIGFNAIETVYSMAAPEQP